MFEVKSAPSPAKESVLIAMSGGVDSSAAACLLVESGFTCAGAMMKLFDNEAIGQDKGRPCCTLADAGDARAVADALGIPFFVFNFTDSFAAQVMDRFADTYRRGWTPNPCIDCNRFLKFDRLLRRAAELGYDRVATGHYARVAREGERYLLKRGLDAAKDQSYVLYAMTQAQLARTLFPVGELRKPQVRALAEARGFVNAAKRDSQDICFVPDGDYGVFLERYLGQPLPTGRFVDTQGRTLGTHRGYMRYTVGQRRGLGVSADQPLYVKEIRPEDNTVVLAHDEDLYGKTLTARDINLIPIPRLDGPLRVTAKLRYKHAEQPATVWQTGADELRVTFDAPQRAITRGQAVVLYDGETVVGGGTIVSP
ncbi:MAG: tRNA 2-thiouridine(34) synthase MnmA [Oscillospiraceae bacterium]|jgi:tRNA-specific 2-thiouridylase|nr:tRNA 2-thiouridine(34) synthase MnmA [Oscillospiraceae bacterium]